MKKSLDLTSGIVWKRLFVFFLPIAAGTLIQQLYNAVDGFIVEKYVGTVALAAVGGSPAQIINVLIGFFVALTSGASVVIAQIYGAGKLEEVKKATGNAVAICGIIGLGLMGIGLLFSPYMLRLLKTPEETLELANLYLSIYFTGVPFMLIVNMESNLLRAVGDSKSPFYFMIVGCLSNVVMDFLFVALFDMGVFGAAIATVIAQGINMFLLTGKLLLTKEPYKLVLREMKLNRQYLSAMLHFGIPAGLQSSMYNVSNMIIQVGVNSLGTIVVASWAMSSKTDGFYWAVSNALGAAITAFVAQNLGAGKEDRIRKCMKQGLIMHVSITVLMSTLLLTLAKPVLHILTDDIAVIDTTFEMMCYFVPFYVIWSFIEVTSSLLRGAGDAVRPVIITGLGICLFRVLWMVSVFLIFRSVPVLCLSYGISWIITSIALLIYYKKSNWISRTGTRLIEK